MHSANKANTVKDKSICKLKLQPMPVLSFAQ